MPGAGQASGAVVSPPGLSPFVNYTEILQLVPVCRRTLENWKKKGILPYIKIGRRTLYHLESVKSALMRMQRGGNGQS